ncbi:SEP domain [Trypanosoma vivax]|uniref:SEP domain-containing protein n=1 Tax=Trypanosoma vivax (strain Y486) TaxID=1055687 RepID=F9WV59_TRYVY|nr:SEP domain [Trypanosoma vivax]CCD21464.1 hypothetical protein, conserved [Trypanosoma vivax Y486]|eukprot:CCD21464.1 hypothetical protein, conserved [Trypanosoma vivax Y486]
MSDEEKSKKPETRFVGGGPSSGQQVVAGAGGSVDEIIQSLFLKSEQNTFQESTNNASAFLGYGRRIGRVPAFTPFMSPVVHEQHTVHLRVYNNGYTIDDGPLMEKDTSDSLEFFRDLSEGYVPGRIAAMYPQTKISVRVVDCTGIDYKTAFTPFPGRGVRISDKAQDEGTSNKASEDNVAENIEVPRKSFVLEVHDDEEKADVAIINFVGERKQFTVNPNRHTVGDVFNLAAAYGKAIADSFSLVVRDVPPRALRDKSLTVKDAGICNCVMMMRPL